MKKYWENWLELIGYRAPTMYAKNTENTEKKNKVKNQDSITRKWGEKSLAEITP